MLELLRKASHDDARVIDIKTQVSYILIPAQPGERATTYRADFVVTYASGRIEVIDVKSEVTRRIPTYVIKRKLMLSRHGITLREM